VAEGALGGFLGACVGCWPGLGGLAGWGGCWRGWGRLEGLEAASVGCVGDWGPGASGGLTGGLDWTGLDWGDAQTSISAATQPAN
jgi:hypothetical protein